MLFQNHQITTTQLAVHSMNVKNTLKDRIRGWFPHEPTLISTRLMVNHEYKQQPPKIQLDYRESATGAAKTTALSWIILYGFIISVLFFTLQSYNGLKLASWIIIGSAVGIISGKAYVQNQLLRISRDYRIKLNLKDFILSIASFASNSPAWFFCGFVSSKRGAAVSIIRACPCVVCLFDFPTNNQICFVPRL